MAMSDGLTRRDFCKRVAAAGALSLLALGKKTAPALAASAAKAGKATVIDLTKCNGCKGSAVPECVLACREHNRERFPKVQYPIKYYWPQKKYEDWSDKKDLTTRLTPYNWTFVDQVTVEHQGKTEQVFIPRRCMHCDHPTCLKLCPFSAIRKDSSGAVIIDDGICFGGAKCRDVCPWGIPQRQAGVGLYLKVAPELAGGGVMYKCDLCSDLIAQGDEPACVKACPQGALQFGSKDEMRALAYNRAAEINGYVYGDKENGGTSTFYVSKVPFEVIDAAIKKDKAAKGDTAPGRPPMPVSVKNYLDTTQGLALSTFIAPIAGMALAGVTAYRTLKGERRHGAE